MLLFYCIFLNCPRKFRDKERYKAKHRNRVRMIEPVCVTERNFGVAFIKGEQLYGCDEQAEGCDTRLNNEKYPPLPEEELKAEQEKIKEFFAENLALIVRALKYLDTDTVNQMMSKRTNSFNRSLLNINMLSDDNLELLSKLIKKTNSTKNKLELCQLMRLCRVKSDNKSILKEMAQKDVITMEMINTAKRKVKEEFLNGILINIGFLKDEIEKIPLEKLNFNEEYIHTLNDLRGESAYNLIHSYINDDFSKYIKDKSNEYGQANAKTKAAFAKNKLNYDKWLNPNIEDEIIKINGKNYKFKIWDRNPQEDLFIGNKTNCCTAIGGSNGEATPIYLLNTAFNVVELCDEDGNTAAMARVFAGKINNKPALIMDTLETSLNTGTIELRNAFFEYMKKYSKAVTGKENTPVYYSSSYAKVPTSDLEKKDVFVGFIGNVYPDSVYINSKQNWIDPALMKCSGYTELYRAV